MGPGHFGVALAAKPLAPRIPLWILLVASEGLDILSFIFLSVGLETKFVRIVSLERGIVILSPGVYHWSHGLFMTFIWSSIVILITWLITRNQISAFVGGMVFFSHWVLDFFVHTPDLPLFFDGSPNLGLGLWGSGTGFILSEIIELVILGGGLIIYLRWRRLQSRKKIPNQR
jgi:hypothetical protein